VFAERLTFGVSGEHLKPFESVLPTAMSTDAVPSVVPDAVASVGVCVSELPET
jgi:hypothetical protein